MTVVTMVWVQEHVHEVRNATKAVLSYLAFKAHYDDGTAAWPAIGTIAGACGLSEKTVQRSIDQLLDLGLIEPGQQTFSAINPKTGKPVRRNYQTVVWNVICKESNLPTEPFEDRNASKVRAAMKRADKAKAKMPSPEPEGGEDDGSEDKMSKNLDKMSPNNTLKYNYPSLPTGELPASGKRPGMEDGNNTTTGGDSDAATVMDHLASVRSKLSLTTTEPTKRDLSKIGNLVSRVVKARDGDRAASLALILAVIDWLPANTFWLRRVDSARRLADNWDQIANDWTVAQIERQRERDAEAHERDRRPVAQPTPVPERHSERHVHSLVCEHVLNDMRPHEDEYGHEGSLRYGKPSEWQMACMRHADELNRLEGIETAA